MTTQAHIISTLKAHKADLLQCGILRIGLFGSYLRNEQTKTSDIDLLIDFQPNMESFDNFMKVYDLCEGLFKHEKVEIVTKNGLSPYIGPKILNDVLYV